MKKITNYKTISTAQGDQGKSKNYSNQEYSKSDLLFDTLGNLDELSSVLGVLYHYTNNQEKIKSIQKTLQNISSLVATSDETIRTNKLIQLTNKDVQNLEELEQTLLLNSSLEPRFVLPGSDTSKAGAFYDLARSVCRRTERKLVRFIEIKNRGDLADCLRYLNRLSDLLFIYARVLAK